MHKIACVSVIFYTNIYMSSLVSGACWRCLPSPAASVQLLSSSCPGWHSPVCRFDHLAEFTTYPRGSQTQAHPLHTPSSGGMEQALINTPMSVYSSKCNISLLLPRLSAGAGNCSSCSLHTHGIKGEIPQGESWEIIHSEKRTAGFIRCRRSAGQQYWLGPFYTWLAPFTLLSVNSNLFLPAPPSSACILCTRYNPTKPFQHPRHSVACIFISCELTLSGAHQLPSLTSLFLIIVFFNAGW